jgi:hypothetical protein
MQNDRMVYKHPGIHEIHGGNFDYAIIYDTEEAIVEAIAAGWQLTTTEALHIDDAVDVPEEEPTQLPEVDPAKLWASAPIVEK